jgi:hypothetical protein
VVLGELGVADLRGQQTSFEEEVFAEAELLAAQRAHDESHTAGVPCLTAIVPGVRIFPFLAVAVTVF